MTLAIALLSLVLSVVNVAWQVRQHVLSGARVEVALRWGGMGQGRVVSGPVRGSLESTLGHAGVDTPIFRVRGANGGRSAVDVTDFAVELEGGGAMSIAAAGYNPSLPHRLEPGSAVTFSVPLDLVEGLITGFSEGAQGRIRGTLDLAVGGQKSSDWVTYSVAEHGPSAQEPQRRLRPRVGRS